jgi:hypothetical protein
MEAIMRAYVLLVVLAGVAICALAYMAIPQDQTDAGYACADDCSGYEAGYKWAEQHSIDDEDYCAEGDSQSFHDGCIAYTQREISRDR